MKRIFVLITTLMLAVTLCGCNNNTTEELKELQQKNKELQAQLEKKNEQIKKLESKPTSTPVPTPSSTTSPSKNSGSTYKSSASTAVFTNKYGTASTKCAHPGCNNYIASSGDTNCCTTHSNRCLQCGKYIDGDAMYCIDCLVVALDTLSGK